MINRNGKYDVNADRAIYQTIALVTAIRGVSIIECNYNTSPSAITVALIAIISKLPSLL